MSPSFDEGTDVLRDWTAGNQRHFASSLNIPSRDGNSTDQSVSEDGPEASYKGGNRAGTGSAVSGDACKVGSTNPTPQQPRSPDSDNLTDSEREKLRQLEFLGHIGDFVGRIWNHLQAAARAEDVPLPNRVGEVSRCLKEEAQSESRTGSCTEAVELAVECLKKSGKQINIKMAQLAIDTYTDRNHTFHSEAARHERTHDQEGLETAVKDLLTKLPRLLNKEQMEDIRNWSNIVNFYTSGPPIYRRNTRNNNTSEVFNSGVRARTISNDRLFSAIHESSFEDGAFRIPEIASLPSKRPLDTGSYSDTGSLPSNKSPAKRLRLTEGDSGVETPPLTEPDRSMIAYFKNLRTSRSESGQVPSAYARSK